MESRVKLQAELKTVQAKRSVTPVFEGAASDHSPAQPGEMSCLADTCKINIPDLTKWAGRLGNGDAFDTASTEINNLCEANDVLTITENQPLTNVISLIFSPVVIAVLFHILLLLASLLQGVRITRKSTFTTKTTSGLTRKF